MKANESPEKIYLYENLFGRAADYWLREKSSATDIEYTRTDAFIEKAELFFYSALNDGIMGSCDIENFIRLFRNQMKEE